MERFKQWKEFSFCFLTSCRLKDFRINVNGKLPIGVTSKDVILQTIGKIGTAGGTGMVIEYAGSVITNLNIEQRMTVCNMSIEAGARAGLIAPDEKTIQYLKDKPMSPKKTNWDKAIEYWSKLESDIGAKFDLEVEIKGDDISPMVTWGTSPQDVVSVTGFVPDPEKEKDLNRKTSPLIKPHNAILIDNSNTFKSTCNQINTILNKK